MFHMKHAWNINVSLRHTLCSCSPSGILMAPITTLWWVGVCRKWTTCVQFAFHFQTKKRDGESVFGGNRVTSRGNRKAKQLKEPFHLKLSARGMAAMLAMDCPVRGSACSAVIYRQLVLVPVNRFSAANQFPYKSILIGPAGWTMSFSAFKWEKEGGHFPDVCNIQWNVLFCVETVGDMTKMNSKLYRVNYRKVAQLFTNSVVCQHVTKNAFFLWLSQTHTCRGDTRAQGPFYNTDLLQRLLKQLSIIPNPTLLAYGGVHNTTGQNSVMLIH